MSKYPDLPRQEPTNPYNAGYAPPPYEQPGVPPPGPVTVEVLTTVVPVGPEPTRLTCPSCRAQIVTNVETEPSTKTHIIALLLCLFVCWPCVCMPYCMDSCQNARHNCPNCGAYLGTFKN